MTDAAPSLTPRWRDLVEMRPYDRDHWAALRVALAVAIPMVALWAIGRSDLALYAVFGAFTSVYGRNFPHLPRLRLQAIAGSAQLLSIAVGGLIALSPSRHLIVTVVAAVWAGGCSLLADRVRWLPPGPMFQVFALAAVASAATTPRELGAGLITAVASIACALLIGFAGRVLWRSAPGRLHNPYTKPIVVPPPANGVVGTAVVYVIGAAVAGTIPLVIGIGHPYWAVVSAIAALSVPSAYHRVLRATHRFLGTMIGLALGAALLVFRPEGLWAIALVVLLQAAAELFVIRNYSLALIFLTPLVLVIGEMAGPQPVGELMWQRGVETFIGVAVATAITLVLEWRGRRLRRRGAGQ
jgi:hypothetical protein